MLRAKIIYKKYNQIYNTSTWKANRTKKKATSYVITVIDQKVYLPKRSTGSKVSVQF